MTQCLALLARHSPASHFHGAAKRKNIMLFIGHWRILSGNRNAVIERFAKTGGQAPQGVKMLGRWHDVANGTGFSISEADDASAMARWALEWSDLMEMEIHPALNDEQLGAVLAGLQPR
jgi:hypothetical protein